MAEVGQGGEVPGIQGHCPPVTAKKGFSNVSGKSTYFMSGQGLNIFYGQGFIFLVNKGLLLTPTDLCLKDLDKILLVEQDPGAHHYLVPGTVPIKGKKPGVLGAH